MKNNPIKIIFGVFLVLIGASLFTQELGVVLPYNINVWDFVTLFWPALIIFWGIKTYEKNKTFSFILISFGSIIFLNTFFDYNFFNIFWPLLIIFWGISILLKKDRVQAFTSEETVTDEYITETVVFSGLEKKVSSKTFRGGELNTAFGALDLDLRKVEFKNKTARLNVNVAFGATSILLPENVNVVSSGTPILGSWENSVTNTNENKKTIEISGSAIFGGVELKN